jgi:hypothetical protein
MAAFLGSSTDVLAGRDVRIGRQFAADLGPRDTVAAVAVTGSGRSLRAATIVVPSCGVKAAIGAAAVRERGRCHTREGATYLEADIEFVDFERAKARVTILRRLDPVYGMGTMDYGMSCYVLESSAGVWKVTATCGGAVS